MATNYDKMVLANRKRAIRTLGLVNSLVEEEIRQMMFQISAIIQVGDSSLPFTMRTFNSKAFQAQMSTIFSNFDASFSRKLIQEMSALVGQNIEASMRATIGVLNQNSYFENVAGDFVKGSFNLGSIGLNFLAIPQRLITQSVTGFLGGFTLSDRIWRNSQASRKAINRLILQGIRNQLSAQEIAQQLRPFVLSPLNQAQRIDLRILRGANRKLGQSIKAKTLRLARTEIGRAYFDAERERGKVSPIVLAQKWNLSSSHGERVGFDVCDVLASTDAFGLGSGVYPAGSVPISPHPNDLCFLTDVRRPPAEWHLKKPKIKRQIDLRSFKPDFPELNTRFTVRAPSAVGSTIARQATFTENKRDRILSDFTSLLNP